MPGKQRRIVPMYISEDEDEQNDAPVAALEEIRSSNPAQTASGGPSPSAPVAAAPSSSSSSSSAHAHITTAAPTGHGQESSSSSSISVMLNKPSKKLLKRKRRENALTMICLPGWVTHIPKEQGAPAITSISVSCDGQRFATSGSDKTVKIWDFAALLRDEEEDGSSAAPRLLCTLSTFAYTINCVRWSPVNPRVLITGGDRSESSISVFKLKRTSKKPPASAWESAGASADNVENWNRELVCGGHTMAVQDISWEPEGERFATCSHDKTVRVWELASGKEVHGARLKHASMVLGVAWDPLGRYIAAQCEDALVIWDALTWTLVKTLKEGFRSKNFSGDPNLHLHTQSTFYRISWTPGGRFLLGSGGSVQNPGGELVWSSPKYKRGTWACELNYTGPGLPTTVTRACPILFCNPDKRNSEPFSVVAIGAMDNTISIRGEGKAVPLGLAQDWFTKSVVDAAWDYTGRFCLFCTNDGYVVCIRFAENAFGGQPLSAGEVSKLMKARTMDRTLPHGLDALRLQQKAKQQKGGQYNFHNDSAKRKAATAFPSSSSSSSSSSSAPVANSSSSFAAPIAHSPSKPSLHKRRALNGSGRAASASIPSSMPVTSGSQVMLRAPGAISMLSASMPSGHTATVTNRLVALVDAKDGKYHWKSSLPAMATHLCAARSCVVVATVSRRPNSPGAELHIFNGSGTRMAPPLMLEAEVCFLHLSATRDLLVITATGDLLVYGLDAMELLMKDSVASVLRNTTRETIVTADLKYGQGMCAPMPVVALTGGAVFAYHDPLQLWMLVHDSSLHLGSQFGSNPDRDGLVASLTPSSALEDSKKTAIDTARRLKNLSPAQVRDASITHLEHQISLARLMRSGREYVKWSADYIRFLVSCEAGSGDPTPFVGRLQGFVLQMLALVQDTPTWAREMQLSTGDLFDEVRKCLGASRSEEVQRLFGMFNQHNAM